MMKTNKNYRPPMILQEVSVQIERDFLEASIVDESLMVISNGQEAVDINASSSTFNWNSQWDWENGGN